MHVSPLGYDNGQLVRRITRGDGTSEKTSTLNVRTVRSVPLSIPRKVEESWHPPTSRCGRVLMPTAAFKKLK